MECVRTAATPLLKCAPFLPGGPWRGPATVVGTVVRLTPDDLGGHPSASVHAIQPSAALRATTGGVVCWFRWQGSSRADLFAIEGGGAPLRQLVVRLGAPLGGGEEASLSIDVLTPSGATSVRVPGDAHRWRDGRWHLLAVIQEGDGLRVIIDGKATPTTVAAHLSDGDHPSALWLCDVLAGARGGTVTLAPPAVGASVGAATGLSVGELVITAAPPTVSLCAAHYQQAMPRLALAAAPAAYHGPRRRSFRTSMADHPSAATRAQAEAVAAQLRAAARGRWGKLAAHYVPSQRKVFRAGKRGGPPNDAARRQLLAVVELAMDHERGRRDEDARKVAQPAGARRRPSLAEHGRRSSVDEGDGNGAPPASPPPTGAAPSHQRTPSSGRKLVAGGKSKPFWETREAKRQGVRA